MKLEILKPENEENPLEKTSLLRETDD